MSERAVLRGFFCGTIDLIQVQKSIDFDFGFYNKTKHPRNINW
jgi:hypothetical protein